jgi:epoxyqueuosine reductase
LTSKIYIKDDSETTTKILTENSFQFKLEKVARELGADLFGVADLKDAQEFICNQGGDYLRKFPKAVSIGIHLMDAVVDELHRHEEIPVIFSYRALYNSVNSRLDHIGLLLAGRIQKEGFQAYPIPASQIIDYDRLIGTISNKLAPSLAGLGWIGKSCLLVTPEYGPRVRFATILTDAPLKVSLPMKTQCAACKRCVDICPPKAFTGVPFDPKEPREVRFNAHACYNYMKRREQKLGEQLCGLCVYICPYGVHTRSKKLS